MRTRWLTIALLLLAPVPAVAEWQVRPFIGFTFGGATTFVDPEGAVGERNPSIGISGGWLGEIFGFEGDFGRAPGYFQVFDRDAPESLVLDSGVNTLTGSVVIALPRRLAEYSLRPYFVAGAGMMHVSHNSKHGALPVESTLPAMSIGVGVTGFLTNRIGLNWDVRRFSSLQGESDTVGNSFARERLSFWRATMAVAVRY